MVEFKGLYLRKFGFFFKTVLNVIILLKYVLKVNTCYLKRNT